MKIYKFGGASVKNAKAIKNMFAIVCACSEDLLVVVSALGKTTNAFEKLINQYFRQNNFKEELQQIRQFHEEIINELEINDQSFLKYFKKLEAELLVKPSLSYNYEYDRLIVYGELFSTLIISSFFEKQNKAHQWIDIRNLIITDDNYKFANVLWDKTEENCRNFFSKNQSPLFITQGFIAASEHKKNTSLGREGSDYSAAVLSYILDAKDLIVWKDVPGILNADPRLFKNASLIEALSYREAIELAFYGAQVIHPKTIQPIKRKKIPMHVKSFLAPQQEGTLIGECLQSQAPCSLIFKKNQVLLSIRTKDFSFVDEQNISLIFEILSRYSAKVNMMQNSAVSFSVAIDYHEMTFESLYENLSEQFEIRYNQNLELITIRNYQNYPVDTLIDNRIIYLEQKSRQTAQFLLPEL